ncbi:MAG: tetratricopeptide repeat protein [Candidatus Riflebacteria bacterium]|nr:tetratricopeptide repeat protein [Candidatus Riflebacteria bacterium]
MQVRAVTFSVLLLLMLTFAAIAQEEGLSLSVELDGLGEILLERTSGDQIETTQLLLKKPGGMRQVIDSYNGLLPTDLIKHDLDADGSPELIALLRHPDGIDVIMHIYRTDTDFKKIFPENENENNPLICREVFVSTHGNQPAVCTRHLVAYHDFGPPELYRLEFYQLQKDHLVLAQQGFTEGNHFNILMNRGAQAFHSGQYLEALDYYNQAISSSTGEISSRAFIESLFYLAESHKYLKDFKSALELYQKIVLEFSQNPFTNDAQREAELISQNLEHPEALSFYIEVNNHINCDRWETALELLQKNPMGNADGPLLDRMLFIRAEVLTALNRVEESIEVYHTIQQKFPASPIIDDVNAALEDMQEKPEETDGL